MSLDGNETFSLEDGKYEFERDGRGLLVAARRNGEPWPEGLEAFQFAKAFHAALNEINVLRNALSKSCGDDAEAVAALIESQRN